MADFSGLFRALLWSVLFHAVLFWPQAAPSASGAASMLQARLHAVPRPAAVAAPLAVPVPEPQRVRPGPPRVASAPVSASPTASGAATPLPAATQALPEYTIGADAGGLRQYRVDLAAWLARHPDWRRSPGAEIRGQAVVAVHVPGDGRTPQVALVRSDPGTLPTEQLLLAVRTAVDHTALPAVLQGRPLVLHLPFEFER